MGEFPFTINGQQVPHVGDVLFACMAKFETSDLLRFRSVSRTWRDMVDKETFLWARFRLDQAVTDGTINMFQLIIDKVDNKNPADLFGKTTLHTTAARGFVDMSRLILNNVADKNP